jgi:hypothetical protein
MSLTICVYLLPSSIPGALMAVQPLTAHICGLTEFPAAIHAAVVLWLMGPDTLTFAINFDILRELPRRSKNRVPEALVRYCV